MSLPIQPISPLDGRYRAAVAEIGEYLSEAGLNRARVHVEVEWLILLADRGMFGVEALNAADQAELRRFAADFGQEQIDQLAALEAVTRHDVKAVEYLIREHLTSVGLDRVAELVHFACTSEDINNLAYALTIGDAVDRVWQPKLDAAIAALTDLAVATRAVPMLAHTHGQPATPTTMGKELAVVVHRLQRQRARAAAIAPMGKLNGATGTYAAHLAASPETDWPALSESFVTSLGLAWNPLTTQIESHDWQAELYQAISLANRILHNLCTDVWTYISMGYFRQVPQAGATGSSTMPHKVNPIRFENAEANLELSNAILDSLAASGLRSGTRCSRSTTSRVVSARSQSTRRSSPPISTPIRRCSARRSRRSSAPRWPPGARRSKTHTRCSRSSLVGAGYRQQTCASSSADSKSGMRRRRDCSS